MTKAFNLVFILLVLILLCAPHVNAQTTEITYQGNLIVSGTPANATYDFEFRLFDSLTGGTQAGSVISQIGVAVSNGVFSIKLNFGQNFPGADRYLDITVRPAGGGAFTPLNPRQKLGSVPYAIQSLNAANATNAISAVNAQSLGGVLASQYIVTVDPRLADSRNPLAGSTNYIQNTNSQQATSNFNVSGIGSANTFNATARYNFNGNHLISAIGLNNVFVGASSGLLNTGNHNAFVGASSGFENKAGFNNSFFGAFSGQNNITGNNNSFFGAFSGSATTSGSDNSFFGHRSGLANTAGEYNSFFGTFSGTFNTSGSDNSFFGNSTGFSSNGNRNSFFGSQAGYVNTTGSDNSFLGSFAGRANSTGSNNAFVGSSAGSLNATGVNNAFVGSNAGFSNTASGNSFFGKDSGYFNSGGANNSFFGHSAGRSNLVGELNVFIGNNAGIGNTLGSSNTVIGAEANVLAGNLTYATVIGAEAVVSTSNSVVLGRPADTVRIPGSLSVLGTLTATTLSISASNITGVLGAPNGGTGLSVVGTLGNFLRSNGTAWVSQPFLVSDIPSGSTSYVQNTSVQQGTSNFNISGNGTAGGTLSGNAVNTVTQYNIAGTRVFSSPGLSNLFAGAGSGNANTTGASNSFFGTSAGSINSSGGGNSFFGGNSGLNTSTGSNNTFIGSATGQSNTTGTNNSYIGANAGQANTVGGNNTLIGSNSNVGGNNLTYATAIGSDAIVSTNNTIVLGRNVDTVLAAGNLNVSGTLTAAAFNIPANNISGVVATANGGTGVGASGASGNYLRSNGSAWTTSAIAASDLPAGSANYIQNGVGLQSASNFNVGGTGAVGGLFSANTVNSTTQYNIGGTRVFTANGVNNVFLGAGTATSGDNNSFLGANTALSNTTGTSNTIVGSGANVGAGNLIFATALGSGSIVNDNNSVVLGRTADTVRVPGNLTIAGTFSAATFTLPAANITGVLGFANGGTGINSPGSAGNILRSNGLTWTSSSLIAADIPTGSTNYVQNGIAQQSGVNFNVGGSGTIGGNLAVTGSITGSFNVPAGNITGILSRGNGGTGLGVAGTSGNFLRSDGINWVSSAIAATDIPASSTNYVQNGITPQTGTNFNVAGNGTVGTNLNVGGNLTVAGTINGTFSVAAANITGVIGAANGGTGVNSSGMAGNVLRSNGSSWSSSPLAVSDIPSLGGTYIQNGTSPQLTSNFNISGNGTAGGTMSASIINAVTQYEIGGVRVFTTAGTNNIFAGKATGTAGSSNSFFGDGAGGNNTSGNSNTMIGSNAEVEVAGLNNSTAIGANASVGQSNSLVLGGVTGFNGGTNISVGIGTITPKATLDVTGGNILVASPGQGILLKSPDGLTCKLLRISNLGAIELAAATCP